MPVAAVGHLVGSGTGAMPPYTGSGRASGFDPTAGADAEERGRRIGSSRDVHPSRFAMLCSGRSCSRRAAHSVRPADGRRRLGEPGRRASCSPRRRSGAGTAGGSSNAGSATTPRRLATPPGLRPAGPVPPRGLGARGTRSRDDQVLDRRKLEQGRHRGRRPSLSGRVRPRLGDRCQKWSG
jgi:hypothetical protein